MTAGQDSLAEAARLEAARVYTRTVPECRDDLTPAERERHTIARQARDLHEHGESIAAIAMRVGRSKTTVRNMLARAS